MPSVVRPETQKRLADIRKDYFTAYAKGQRTEVIIEALSDKYYLTPGTILQMVFGRGRYKDS